MCSVEIKNQIMYMKTNITLYTSKYTYIHANEMASIYIHIATLFCSTQAAFIAVCNAVLHVHMKTKKTPLHGDAHAVRLAQILFGLHIDMHIFVF